MVTRIVLLILILFAPRLAAAADVYHAYTDSDPTVSHVVLKWTRNAANWRSPAVTVLDAKALEVSKSRYHHWQKGWTVRIKSELVRTQLVSTQGKPSLREVCASFAQVNCIYALAKINHLAGDIVLPQFLNVPTEFTSQVSAQVLPSAAANALERSNSALAPMAPVGFGASKQALAGTPQSPAPLRNTIDSRAPVAATSNTRSATVEAPRDAGLADPANAARNDPPDSPQKTSARYALIVVAVLLLLCGIFVGYKVLYANRVSEVRAFMELFFEKLKAEMHHDGYIHRDDLRAEFMPADEMMKVFVPISFNGGYPNLTDQQPQFRKSLREILEGLGEPFVLIGDLYEVLYDFGENLGKRPAIVVTFAYLADKRVEATRVATQEVA